MKRLLLFLASSLFLLVFNLPSVYACSGGPEYPSVSLEERLNASVFVRGRVIENSGANSIIEVERYLVGSGSRYLLVYRQAPEAYVTKYVRGYYIGCSFGDFPVANVGDRGYFSLYGSGNGSYSVSDNPRAIRIPIIANEEGLRVDYSEFVDGVAVINDPGLDEFEAMLAERTGHLAVAPDEGFGMPRFRFLKITTESGQAYQLSLNTNEIYPVESNETPCLENCTLVSPDGSHYLIPIPNESNAYWLWYQPNSNGRDLSEGFQEGEYTHYPSEIQAEHVLFSPNSDYLMAWYEGSLTLYRFYNSTLMYGGYPAKERIWSAQLAVTETRTAESFSGLAAWSGNSNAFAYWDADGLKWLDMTAMLVPRLLLEHDAGDIQGLANLANQGIPPVLELSSTGRYIRYGDAEEWSLLDVLTNTVYDDSLLSPDEMSFVAIEPEIYPHQLRRPAEEGECIMSDLEGNCLMQQQNYGDGCALPLATCASYIHLNDFQLRELYWQGQNMVYMVCENPASNLCYVMMADFENAGYWGYPPERFETNAFAYDSYYGYVAWATDDYQLRLGVSIYDEPLDFSAVLDSPIVSLEWGRALWYLGEE